MQRYRLAEDRLRENHPIMVAVLDIGVVGGLRMATEEAEVN